MSQDSRRFPRIIVDDFKQGGHRRTIRRDLQDLYRFYLDEDARNRLASMNRVKRWFLMVWWLLKSLFLNLSPTRRILLLLSMWLTMQGDIQFSFGEAQFNLGFRNWGFLLLLVILMLELKDKLLARDELETGRKVQLSLLPEDHPELPGWEIRLYTQPANDVGGDLIDYLRLGDGRLGVAVGDVAGKGLGAALLMSKLQATLRALASEFVSLDELGSRMNQIFYRDKVGERYATLVYLELQPDSGAVRLLNAGHLPPVLVRRSGVEELPPVAPPVGMLGDSTYREQDVELGEGDLLVVFSDGVTEAMDANRRFFGEDRLMDLLREGHGLHPGELARRVLDAVERFAGEERPSDDLSLVILKRGGRP